MTNRDIPASGRGDIIGSDSPISAEQRETLDAMLNLLIPPSDDGRLPGAAEVGVLAQLHDANSDIIPTLCTQLDQLEARARERFGEAFSKLSQNDRQAVLNEMQSGEANFLRGLIMETVTGYYRDDRVLEAIGMEARPPYPKGYEVEAGDLSLLDPVIQRGKRFRDA